MNSYSFTHLSDGALVRALETQVSEERSHTAVLVALIAEVEQRRLYAGMGYPSMHAYCVQKLHLSEDAAYKRIQAARAARRFPAILGAIADGRLSLTVIVRLKPQLTRENWRELLTAGVHKTRKEVEHLLAIRFPSPDVPTALVPIAPTVSTLASGAAAPEALGNAVAQLVPEPVGSLAPANDAGSVMVALPTVARVEPLSAESYKAQFTMSKATHDLLRRAQELLGHQVSAGDVDTVLRSGLELLVAQLEKRKFAATDKPRVGKPSRDPRHIPAYVKRAVRERDKDQCAFVGDNGKRCEARRGLEFDHIEPVARGGDSTVANVRLLCRTHNQLVAERVFGDALMEGKRATAMERRAQARSA